MTAAAKTLHPALLAPTRWSRMMGEVREEVGDAVFGAWFGRLELDMVENGVARMSVPTLFLRTWIRTRYLDLLDAVAPRHLEGVRSVHVAIRSAAKPRQDDPSPGRGEAALPARDVAEADAAVPEPAAPRTASPSALAPRHDFANFLEGPSNAVAVAVGRLVATPDGDGAMNPFTVQAGPGGGKTHLLQAIAHGVAAAGRQALYMNAPRFMYDFALVLRDQGAQRFRALIEEVDVLLVDDVQHLHGRSAHRAFGEALAAMVDSGRRVVVATDRPVRDLDKLEDRARARLEGGFPAFIGMPDEALRGAILALRIAEAGEVVRKSGAPDVPAAVVARLAAGIAGSPRDLGGAANRLVAYVSGGERPATDAIADAVIAEAARPRPPRRPRIEDVQRLAAAHYGCDREAMTGNRRTADVVRPRQIAMYLCKVLTDRSLPEIGRRFGGRDHTTVLHAVSKIEKLRAADPDLDEELRVLSRMLCEAAS